MTFDISSFLGNFGFSKPTSIDFQKVKHSHELTPKRICFSNSHSNALKKIAGKDFVGTLNIPFKESISDIFDKETGLSFFKTKFDKFWCPLNKDEDYDKALAFKNKYENNVFLRDNLDLSIALAENIINDETRTIIGELEYQAKYHHCKVSTEKLIELCSDFISGTPFYKDCKYICSIPPSIKGNENLPTNICNGIAHRLEITSLCNEVQWKKDKSPLKELSFEERWNILEETSMNLNLNLKNIDVILIDDLYQSGTTMQYVAMKLKEAGCRKVYGLSLVKSRRDTDNQ